MIYTQTRAAARSAFDELVLAKAPPSALLQRACDTFARMIAEMTGERCQVIIGSVVMARKAA
jgi:hypothetical protein